MTIVKIRQKIQKSVWLKESLNLKIVKNCLEAIELENKIRHLEKSIIGVEGLKKCCK